MKAAEFKKIRKELGYTQEQLAKIIGYSRQHVNNYENEKYEIEKAIGLLLKFMQQASDKTRADILGAK